MKKKTKVMITAVGAPPGYNAAKALEKHDDLSLILLDANTYASGLYRFEQSVSYLVPPAKEEPKYIQALLDIAWKESAEVILPCLEDETLVISKNLDAFSKAGVSVPIPDYKKIIQGCNKFKLNQIADKLKVPHPKSFEINGIGDLPEIDLEYPVILKPQIGHGARGFVFINDLSELKKKTAELLAQFGGLILQEMVPGTDGSILLCGLLYDHKKNLKITFQSRSLKTLYSFGGPAIVGEAIQHPEILDWSKSIMQEIGEWIGPVNLEYKVHEKTGVPYLMDFNPRLWGYGSLPVFCGIDFPYQWVQVGLNKEIAEKHDYDMSKVMIRANEDFAITKAELKRLQ